MNLKFLRRLDRWFGPLLLQVLAPVLRVFEALSPRIKDLPLAELRDKVVFLKLKGGGSLLMAYPALLGLRQAAPLAKFSLVCTAETKVYAEILGIFDSYSVIDDVSADSLVKSAYNALKLCNGAYLCIDLEINSVLAAAFSMLTLAMRRVGFVKPEEKYRARAYTDAISFNIYAPIYVFYDQITELLGCTAAAITDCRAKLLQGNPALSLYSVGRDEGILGLFPFTSDFAQERMMPPEVWGRLLADKKPAAVRQIKIFGSEKNRPKADGFILQLHQTLPQIDIVNLCGKYDLAETLVEIANCGAIWSIDSGLLHAARLLGVPSRSFWGPTNPAQRLRPIAGLDETTDYLGYVCSPCVHLADGPPCGGNNLCMKSMAVPSPDISPLWRIGGTRL